LLGEAEVKNQKARVKSTEAIGYEYKNSKQANDTSCRNFCGMSHVM